MLLWRWGGSCAPRGVDLSSYIRSRSGKSPTGLADLDPQNHLVPLRFVRDHARLLVELGRNPACVPPAGSWGVRATVGRPVDMYGRTLPHSFGINCSSHPTWDGSTCGLRPGGLLACRNLQRLVRFSICSITRSRFRQYSNISIHSALGGWLPTGPCSPSSRSRLVSRFFLILLSFCTCSPRRCGPRWRVLYGPRW